jgi:hypothetical protein
LSTSPDISIVTFGDDAEKPRRRVLADLLRNCPIPEDELLMNMGLFLTPQNLSRILFMDHLYRKIIDLQGVVVEFGCRWGQNLALFTALRGIYEPFNRLRKIVGFDTFEGLSGVVEKDGALMKPQGYSVTPEYERYLETLLALQEKESPLPHLRKFEIIKGDAVSGIEAYLDRNPHTIIALAYFDMDIYEPTRKCLESIKGRMTKGGIIGFDEINDPATPGETLALKEVFGLDRYPVRRYRYNSRTSYIRLI